MASPFWIFFFFFSPCFLYQLRFRFLILSGPPSAFSFMFFISVVPWFPSSSSMLPLSLCPRPTSAADTWRALERYFEFKLSLTFFCSFAESDLVWLAHRSPQGLSWVAYGLPLLKVRVGLLPQFRWQCLGMIAVLCVLFWTENLQNLPRTFSKVKINMLQRDQKSKKHLASQQMNSLVSFVQQHFGKKPPCIHSF